MFSKDDLQRVFVRKVVGNDTVGLAEFPLEEVRLRWFDWANSSRVILSADAPDPNEVGVEPLVTRIYGVNSKHPRLKWLGEDWGKRGPDWPTTQKRFRDHVLSMYRGDSDSVLLSHVEFGERTPSVSKLNIVSGRLRKLEGPRSGLEAWHVDTDGVIRAAEVLGESSDRKSYTLLGRAEGSDELAPVLESPDRDVEGYGFAGFHESDELLYVFANRAGRRAVFELDLATKQLGKLVFAHDEYDVEALHHDPALGRYVGARYLADQPEVVYFDEAAGQQQASIDHSLGGGGGRSTTNRIVSASRDGKLSLVEVASDIAPPVYYALDRDRKTISFVFDQRPDFPVDRMSPVESIKFPARDGAMIPAYRTRPREQGDGAGRMIVMLHGGLGARASSIYDPAVQFFASRGYVVLQVNHRGSGGYGRAFEMAGQDKDQVMHVARNDLADAVAWAIEHGDADPARVVIFGADGGGTLAMHALATLPKLFRAGASYGGEMDPGSASEMVVPVLLAHGARNSDVPVESARAFIRALQAASKSVESVEFAEEATGFALERNRIDFYERLLAFFDKHLAAQASTANPTHGDE